MELVELIDVSKAFKGAPVLSGVSLSIERGHCYGLVGPNGSGKSVLMQIMCGLILPDFGSVKIDPSLLTGDRTFPDKFGISINGPAYLPGSSAIENLLDLASIRKRATVLDCKAVLVSVGLDPDSAQRVRNFSLGMKQKLSLAQAFMEDPEVLLLDEPFNALDENSVKRMTELLREKLSADVTIVMTSHHKDEIESLCDVHLSISNGLVRTSALE